MTSVMVPLDNQINHISRRDAERPEKCGFICGQNNGRDLFWPQPITFGAVNR